MTFEPENTVSSENCTCGFGPVVCRVIAQHEDLIEQQAKEIEALRGFAQAVLADGIYGFDSRRLPELALVYGLITTKYKAYGPTGNETMHVESYKTELLTGQKT